MIGVAGMRPADARRNFAALGSAAALAALACAYGPSFERYIADRLKAARLAELGGDGAS